MNPRTKLLIAQPDGAKLVSLLLWLEQYTDLEVVGTTCSGDKVADCTSFHQPDVVLLDFCLLAQDPPAATAKIKSVASAPAILVMHGKRHRTDGVSIEQRSRRLHQPEISAQRTHRNHSQGRSKARRAYVSSIRPCNDGRLGKFIPPKASSPARSQRGLCWSTLRMLAQSRRVNLALMTPDIFYLYSFRVFSGSDLTGDMGFVSN